jgi:hypothetical protein
MTDREARQHFTRTAAWLSRRVPPLTETGYVEGRNVAIDGIRPDFIFAETSG